MKSLLILILALVLAAGAFLSKPSEASFARHVKQQQKTGEGFLGKAAAEVTTKAYLKDAKYRDRVLWADVEKDGKVVYTGAFSRWFKR